MADDHRDETPEAAARRRRLAEALRENLKRRKTQTRERKSEDAAPAPPAVPKRD